VVKRGFKGLQNGILNHPVTVKITELWTVKVGTVVTRLHSGSITFCL